MNTISAFGFMMLVIGLIIAFGNILYMMLLMVNFDPMSVLLTVLLIGGCLLVLIGTIYDK